MATTSRTSVLSEAALLILRARGSNPELLQGFRAVSNTSYLSDDSVDSQATVYIPDQLESVETLQFLEFNLSTANSLWSRFVNYKAAEPEHADLFYFARDHILRLPGNAIAETDDWEGIFQRIGLTPNFRNRIMDPDYKDMRLSASAKEWAIEMITMRYEFLIHMDKFIQAPVPVLSCRVSHFDLNDKKIKPGLSFPPRRSSMESGSPSAGSSTRTLTIDIPDHIEGHKMFFKGGTLDRLRLIHEISGLSIRKLFSRPPGDFSSTNAGLYLTKHDQVAWRYAQWAKKIVDGNVVPVGIMKIAIPDVLLSSIYKLSGDEWRTFVWHNRKNMDLPHGFSHLSAFQWLVGPACHDSPHKVEQMNGKDEITLWKMDGMTAEQNFTSSMHMVAQLNTQCVGKVFITELAKEMK